MDDYFACLGLPKTYYLDRSDLDQRYLNACRQSHPDFQMAMGQGFVQAAEMQLSTLHLAYSVLTDSYLRAEHLLELVGGPSANEHRAVPAEFMEQMFELRERLVDLNGIHDQSRFQDEIEVLLQRADLNLGLGCENLSQPENMVQLREMLNQVAFLRGILRDLDGKFG